MSTQSGHYEMSARRVVVAGGLPGTFLDVTFMSTPEAAAAVNKLNLHVLIDVNGHTQCAGGFYTRTTAHAHTRAHTCSHARTHQSQPWHAARADRRQRQHAVCGLKPVGSLRRSGSAPLATPTLAVPWHCAIAAPCAATRHGASARCALMRHPHFRRP